MVSVFQSACGSCGGLKLDYNKMKLAKTNLCATDFVGGFTSDFSGCRQTPSI